MNGYVTIIGVDFAKNLLQVHGAAADCSVLSCDEKLPLPQAVSFAASHD